jgi:hypothetical protein
MVLILDVSQQVLADMQNVRQGVACCDDGWRLLRSLGALHPITCTIDSQQQNSGDGDMFV